MKENFSEESNNRLLLAEQNGLRLAIACRTLVTGAAFAWYVGAPLIFSEFEPRLAAIFVLLVFTAVGVIHLMVIGTRHDRWWIKYAVYALDVWAICLTFALVPISRSDDIPQIIAFRAYGIYYLFPLVAVACLSLSWRLVVWTGLMCVFAWWAAFLLVLVGMDQTLSWADIPANATRQDYELIFLSIDFIGRGNRIEETAMVFFAALALAVAVYRARGVFFAQVASELQSRRERRGKERVSNLLGRFVPREIAKQLISDEAPLRPQRSVGTALVLDIADFTEFSSKRAPENVINALNSFFSDATRAISAEKGIVITYLGDGFLATFNAPVKSEDHACAALRSAHNLATVAHRHGFSGRIGIATGALVTGTIRNYERQSFTVYGDAVNLAARLEALCKNLKTQVLTDKPTMIEARILDQSHARGAFELQGFSNKIEVFEPPSVNEARILSG